GTGCVLLMACANLANLLLVRASGRRREMQLRTALGASVGQVLSQMTAESAVLVVTGGLAGVVFAVAALDVLRRATSISLARLGDVQVGWPAIAFAAAECAAITFVFGAVALLHVGRRNVLDGLRPHAGI